MNPSVIALVRGPALGGMAPVWSAALLVPSPLNGERGRVRGGSAQQSLLSEKASFATAASFACPVRHFPDAALAFASQPKSFHESSARLSAASSRSGASRCSTLFSETHHAPHQLAGAQEIHADRHPVRDRSGPQHNRSRGSAHQFRAVAGTCKPRNNGREEYAKASSQPTWISSAEAALGVRACRDFVGGGGGVGKSVLACPPLTLTLSPLRGEGTRDTRQIRVSLAYSARLGFIRSKRIAKTGLGVPSSAQHVPSPLNGEKAAEGRLRGGNVPDVDQLDRLWDLDHPAQHEHCNNPLPSFTLSN